LPTTFVRQKYCKHNLWVSKEHTRPAYIHRNITPTYYDSYNIYDPSTFDSLTTTSKHASKDYIYCSLYQAFNCTNARYSIAHGGGCSLMCWYLWSLGFHKKPPLPHCFTGAAFGASIKTNLLACFRRNPTPRPTYTTLLAAFDLDRVRWLVKRENKGTERLTRLACTTIGAVRLASHVGRRDVVSNDCNICGI